MSVTIYLFSDVDGGGVGSKQVWAILAVYACDCPPRILGKSRDGRHVTAKLGEYNPMSSFFFPPCLIFENLPNCGIMIFVYFAKRIYVGSVFTLTVA